MIREKKLKLDRFEWLTFDCYGTLIDWESGVVAALSTVLVAHKIRLHKREILELYGQLEAEFESERREYIRYREVLSRVVMGFAERLGFVPTPEQMQSLVDSIGLWKPFPDTVPALRKLSRKYKLGVISNVDDEFFVSTAKRLQVKFDEVVTAQQVRSYKPALKNFHVAIQQIGVPQTKILHVAQSIYHDIIPARTLGITSVWVNRRGSQLGVGGTNAAVAYADLEVPDLKTLAAMV